MIRWIAPGLALALALMVALLAASQSVDRRIILVSPDEPQETVDLLWDCGFDPIDAEPMPHVICIRRHLVGLPCDELF